MTPAPLEVDNLGVVERGSLIRITVPDATTDHLPMVQRIRCEIENRSGHDEFTVVVVTPDVALEIEPPPHIHNEDGCSRPDLHRSRPSTTRSDT